MIQTYSIDEETLQDIINIETGLLSPLEGFMMYEDYRSVIDYYKLLNGQVWTIPITLDINQELYDVVSINDKIELIYKNSKVAYIEVLDKFKINENDIFNVFKTLDDKHPGVFKEKNRNKCRIGGKTFITNKSLLDDVLTPNNTRDIFKNKGWKTIVGFQTRNPIHNAHEYLQKIGLEICDGLFINPIIGWKKKGDFSEEAVMCAYNTMIEEFYPKERVYLEGLRTQMRYAGPREAIFHAIIRRNLGCTHFIIGRDHAGVGNFYGAYDAHKLAEEITSNHDLGINLLLLHEPYFCTKCNQIVSDKTCSHGLKNKIEISGTIIRNCISNKDIPNETLMRKEISKSILKLENVFI